MANTLEELPLYEKVLEFWDAVNEILSTPALRKDRDLWAQISSANDSIDSNMKGGFEQPTDAAFANAVFNGEGFPRRSHLARAPGAAQGLRLGGTTATRRGPG